MEKQYSIGEVWWVHFPYSDIDKAMDMLSVPTEEREMIKSLV